MTNMSHLFKVTVAWTSIVYAICFFGVALVPSVREIFMYYALHMNVDMGENVATVGTFISGLVIWNAVAVLGVALFAVLFNAIKK